jgi:pimeloyl-ACP methyl ester carboxylesterase
LPQPSPVRPERAGSELSPIERLGRFDGRGFREVTPGSLPPSHLYVLVHGWAPGWGRQLRHHARIRSWEARRRDGRPFEPWVPELARSIEAADPYAVVVAYSWLDDAATGRFLFAQRNAFAHTDLHGRWLADALVEGVSDDFIERAGSVHLIGHSYGARVVTLAAIHMPKKPAQITLFDSPDAPLTYFTGSQTLLASLLRKLPIGTGPGDIFVDNYISMVGIHYHDAPGLSSIVDVVLAPPYGSLDYSRRHLYPMEFYAHTVHRSVGLGWSPLIAEHAPVPGCYQQEYGTMELERGCAGLP